MPEVALMAAVGQAVRFGAFGKMPALGDFFSLSMPGGVLPEWDDWLSHLLLDARAVLRDGWTEAYLSAPIWRFALGPGLLRVGPAAGVLMPSVDRVGRQFPLTIIAAGSPAPMWDGALASPVFDLLEDLALTALDDLSRADLQARLSALAAADWYPNAEAPRVQSQWAALLPNGTWARFAYAGLPRGQDCARLFQPEDRMVEVIL